MSINMVNGNIHGGFHRYMGKSWETMAIYGNILEIPNEIGGLWRFPARKMGVPLKNAGFISWKIPHR